MSHFSNIWTYKLPCISYKIYCKIITVMPSSSCKQKRHIISLIEERLTPHENDNNNNRSDISNNHYLIVNGATFKYIKNSWAFLFTYLFVHLNRIRPISLNKCSIYYLKLLLLHSANMEVFIFKEAILQIIFYYSIMIR